MCVTRKSNPAVDIRSPELHGDSPWQTAALDNPALPLLSPRSSRLPRAPLATSGQGRLEGCRRGRPGCRARPQRRLNETIGEGGTWRRPRRRGSARDVGALRHGVPRRHGRRGGDTGRGGRRRRRRDRATDP